MLIQRDDAKYMGLALKEAEKAFEAGEVPVGAIIVIDGHVIAKAHNQVELLKDATAHAEILAITQASSHVRDWRLSNATMYVTKEPCAMCAGAMVNSRLQKVIFGASDSQYGAAGSALDVTGFDGNLHQVDIVSGVLADDCISMLQRFFRIRRQQNKLK